MSSRAIRIALYAALLAAVGCAEMATGPRHGGGQPVTRQQMLAARMTELRYQIQEGREKLGISQSEGAAFAPSRSDAGLGKNPGVSPVPAPVPMTGPKAARCTQVCDLADAICQDTEELCKIADELGDNDSHNQCEDAQQSCKVAQDRCHRCH